MPEKISTELKQFIDLHIYSLAQLEALLLLRRDPSRSWPAAEVAKTLYVPPELASTLLADLGQRGFIKLSVPAESSYAYLPGNAETDRLIGELDDIYQQRRVAIISLIYSKPVNKVQTFADAFRIRKET